MNTKTEKVKEMAEDVSLEASCIADTICLFWTALSEETNTPIANALWLLSEQAKKLADKCGELTTFIN